MTYRLLLALLLDHIAESLASRLALAGPKVSYATGRTRSESEHCRTLLIPQTPQGFTFENQT
jgi:hypothetical protein